MEWCFARLSTFYGLASQMLCHIQIDKTLKKKTKMFLKMVC